MTNSDPTKGGTRHLGTLAPFVRIGLAILCGGAALFLVSAAAGYMGAMADAGSIDMKDIAILGGFALGVAAMIYAIWRLWARKPGAQLGAAGPGEVRTQQRNRTQLAYFGVALIVGGIVGFATGFFDQGDGSLFAGDLDDLKLPPVLAIGIAILLLGGFLALPLYGFRLIDDYKREHNLVAFTGGCLAVISGYPVWAVLHAGGFLPPPHAFGVFAIAYVAMILSYLYARWRL